MRAPRSLEGWPGAVVVGRRRRTPAATTTTTMTWCGFGFWLLLSGGLGGGRRGGGGGGAGGAKALAWVSFAPPPPPYRNRALPATCGGPIPPFLVGGRVVLDTAHRAKRGDDDEYDKDDNDYDDFNAAFSRRRPTTSFGGSDDVPENQRPVNEYLELLRQPLFDWATDTSKLAVRCAALYTITFGAISYPIAGATFVDVDHDPGMLWPRLAAANVGSLGLVALLLFRLLVGWQYVANRLTSVQVEYEETGWFDGSIQPKTLAEQKRDKFLFQSTVQPVVQRLNSFAVSAALAMVVSIGLYQFALQQHPPRFDQYDPAMLERLKYDPDLAGKAAEAAGVRPAYCDSRYYRAVAGGAPGCR